MEKKAMPAFRKTAETFTAGAKTLPQNYLISPEVFAKEQERIFSTQWLCVGHQSQLAKPGDYFVQEVVGESLIILRDQKGGVSGFYNVCRHRGTRICEEKSGQPARDAPMPSITPGRMVSTEDSSARRTWTKSRVLISSVFVTRS
jgi:hypothetical protein